MGFTARTFNGSKVACQLSLCFIADFWHHDSGAGSSFAQQPLRKKHGSIKETPLARSKWSSKTGSLSIHLEDS
jgi:hypothetical protein